MDAAVTKYDSFCKHTSWRHPGYVFDKIQKRCKKNGAFVAFTSLVSVFTMPIIIALVA